MRLHSEITSCTAAYLAAKLHNFSGTASTTAIFQKLLHATSLHGLKKSAFRCTLQLFQSMLCTFCTTARSCSLPLLEPTQSAWTSYHLSSICISRGFMPKTCMAGVSASCFHSAKVVSGYAAGCVFIFKLQQPISAQAELGLQHTAFPEQVLLVCKTQQNRSSAGTLHSCLQPSLQKHFRTAASLLPALLESLHYLSAHIVLQACRSVLPHFCSLDLVCIVPDCSLHVLQASAPLCEQRLQQLQSAAKAAEAAQAAAATIVHAPRKLQKTAGAAVLQRGCKLRTNTSLHTNLQALRPTFLGCTEPHHLQSLTLHPGTSTASASGTPSKASTCIACCCKDT